MKLKISSDLKWLTPFLRAAYKKYPFTSQLKSVRIYTMPRKKEVKTYGTTYKVKDGFNIALRVRSYNRRGRLEDFFFYTVLEVFAHELAHIAEWNHTPEHFILQAKIQQLFGRIMKKLKIRNYDIAISTFNRRFIYDK